MGWGALRSPRLLLNLQRQIALRNPGKCSVLDLQRLRRTMDCSLLNEALSASLGVFTNTGHAPSLSLLYVHSKSLGHNAFNFLCLLELALRKLSTVHFRCERGVN